MAFTKLIFAGLEPNLVHILSRFIFFYTQKKSQLQNLPTQKNPSVFLHQQILFYIYTI